MAASPPVQREELLNVLTQLSQEIRELDVGNTVDRVPRLSAVEFLRDYVGPNKPVVLTDIIRHWPALTRWTDEYLCNKVGEVEVTVALTPNGRADAVTPLSSSTNTVALTPNGRADAVTPLSSSTSCGGGSSIAKECFALPAQRRMPFSQFLQLFYSSKGAPSCSQQEGAANGEPAAQQQQQQQGQQQQQQQGQQQQQQQQEQQAQHEPESQQLHDEGEAATTERLVPYLQFQNSSLTAELPQLLEDVNEHLPFATEAFGALPEAINIWIGDERSITSWHKDPFENLYAVVAGEKTFTLLPPSDVYRMRLRNYPLATYQSEKVARGPAAAAEGEAAAETAGAARAAAAEAAVGTSSSAGGRLVPVLHQPRESVLWSSVQPEDGWSEGHSAADSGRSSSSDEEGSHNDHGCSNGGERSRGTASKDQPTWAGDLFSDPQLPRPLRVTVKKGEVLYLPAIWWHQVEQQGDENGRMIAVNYWWDMKFDAKYAYFRAVESLAGLAGLADAPQ